MPRPRFSEMLFQRRRELGLSISQAATVLKLKESVLIAFEEGDFTSIPKSGYAQGMLSSYAHYLGLNPREVVDQFSEDLYEHSFGQTSHELRRRTRQTRSTSPGTTDHTGRLGSTSRLGATGRLSSLTPDGDVQDLRGFNTTSEATTRSQSWARPTPLTNSRHTYSNTEATTRFNREDLESRGVSSPRYRQDTQGSDRPYTARVPESAGRTYRSSRPQTRRSQQGPYVPEIEDDRGRAGYRSGDVTSRRVSSQQYVDDMRFDDMASSSFEPASTHIGRRESRNIASTERPNVRRSSTSSERRQLRERRRQEPQHTGILGFFENWFSDSRRTMITVMALLAIVLMLVVVGSIRSCTASRSDTSRRISVTKVASTEAATTEAATTDASTDEAATTEAETQPVTETKVTVSVADGDVSWVEIECDGESKVADTLTGPWEETYTVTQSITIQAGDPSVVTVTKNGEAVTFSAKASGVGTVTIEGTQPQTTSTDASSTDTTTDTTT